MASFRVLGQFVQYFLDDGTVNAGGSVTFYETDLTTLKDTYSDPGLTVLNPNPVPLDADGRLANDVWGSGVYGAVLADVGNVTIQTLNNIQSGSDPGLVIPSLVTGDFLTNDGSNLLWSPVAQVPDPTGSAGNLLSTDGTLTFWATPTSVGIPTVTQGASSIVVGTKKWIFGSGTFPATGTNTTTVSITFPDSGFSGLPYDISLTSTGGPGVTAGGGMLIMGAANRTASGFLAAADVNGFGNISSATGFTYTAVGPA